MDLHLKDSLFIVCGAGSGFGRATAEKLLEEGARVYAVARNEQTMREFGEAYPERLKVFVGDITSDEVQDQMVAACEGERLSGALINAGGPPAMSFLESEMHHWDQAWLQLVRWKLVFTKKLLPLLQQQRYGRFVFIESISVKQPVDNLVLSNALRMAVVGFVKTLALEVAAENINLNILAPGYHNTAAMKRLFAKKSALEKISIDEAKSQFERSIPVGRMGEASEMAELAVWLLSPNSRYITGQTISHDGGMLRSVFG